MPEPTPRDSDAEAQEDQEAAVITGVDRFHHYLTMYRNFKLDYRADHLAHGVRYEVVSGVAFCPMCKTVWTPEGGVEVVKALA